MASIFEPDRLFHFHLCRVNVLSLYHRMTPKTYVSFFSPAIFTSRVIIYVVSQFVNIRSRSKQFM